MAASHPYESAAVRAVTGPTIRPGDFELTRLAARYCRLTAGDRVLDVGCGAGATAGFLNREFQTVAVGVDRSPMLLAEARQCDPDLLVIRGDGAALPVRTERVAAVFCECVLSLLPDPVQALNEFYRVLRPGGHVVVADLYRRAAGTMDTGETATGRGCLRGAVSRELLARRMSEAGFDICLWEDHSDLLKVLAARLVWAGVSLEAFRETAGCRAAEREPLRPGYYLLVAVKGDQPHG
jgi:SAM-dependent methyltransferase